MKFCVVSRAACICSHCRFSETSFKRENKRRTLVCIHIIIVRAAIGKTFYFSFEQRFLLHETKTFQVFCDEKFSLVNAKVQVSLFIANILSHFQSISPASFNIPKENSKMFTENFSLFHFICFKQNFIKKENEKSLNQS